MHDRDSPLICGGDITVLGLGNAARISLVGGRWLASSLWFIIAPNVQTPFLKTEGEGNLCYNRVCPYQCMIDYDLNAQA